MLLNPSLSLCLCALWNIAMAQTLTTYFVQPPGKGAMTDYSENPTYSLNSKLNLEWVTFMDTYSIYLWQQDLTQTAATLGQPIYTKAPSDSEAGTTAWIVDSQGFNLQASNVFFFALGPNITLQGAQTCHYFNLTAAPAKTTASNPSTSSSTTMSSISVSTGSVSTTSVPSLTSISTMTTTSAVTTTATSATVLTSATSQNSAVLDSTTGKLGLGLGVGIGVPIVLILAAFLAWKVRRSGKKQHQIPSYDTRHTHDEPPGWTPRADLASSSYYKPELSSISCDPPKTDRYPSRPHLHELEAR